jgi:hypothetical protein
VIARALRQALLDAISTLPTESDPSARRKAVRGWRKGVARAAFRDHRNLTTFEKDILRNVLPGRDLDPLAIAPEIIPCTGEYDFLTFTYFSLLSSFPSTDRPGRRMKFLIRDMGHRSRPLIGICCLSSPVRQLRVRDEWIGWHGSAHRGTRARNLVFVSDLSTCISIPPYSYLTGGKLLAGLMATDEVRSFYRERYRDQLTLRQSMRADSVFLLTTSGCYGSNAPLYKGIKLGGISLYRFLGYSKGYSHFQIDPTLYNEVKMFVRRRRPETDGKFRTWSNSKIRVLRMAARELEIPEESLVYTGHRRGIFAAPLARNWRELLLGTQQSADPHEYPAAEIIQFWKQTWVPKRLQSRPVREAIRKSSPDDVRISALVEQNDE